MIVSIEKARRRAVAIGVRVLKSLTCFVYVQNYPLHFAAITECHGYILITLCDVTAILTWERYV